MGVPQRQGLWHRRLSLRLLQSNSNHKWTSSQRWVSAWSRRGVHWVPWAVMWKQQLICCCHDLLVNYMPLDRGVGADSHGLGQRSSESFVGRPTSETASHREQKHA